MKSKTEWKKSNTKLKTNHPIVGWKWWWAKPKIWCPNSHIYDTIFFNVGQIVSLVETKNIEMRSYWWLYT